MKRIIMLTFTAAVLAGCGSTQAQTTPSSIPEGKSFTVQDIVNPPPDHSCHPMTLEQLLLPCDRP